MLEFGTRILVVVAHPDDEALGCGGTIARLARQEASVRIVFLADGVSARGKASSDELQQRRAAAAKAAQILGAERPLHLNFPDNRMDTVALLEVVQSVEKVIESYRPDTVLTHHGGDLNIDHRRVHEAVLTACRPQPGHPVERVLAFEVPSSTEWQTTGSPPVFAPNLFVDIGADLATKRLALEAYAVEMRAWPHPRSYEAIEHLARWRGSTAGCDAAEAFVVARLVVRNRGS
jgi:LmbE family N-acetylglucosaminyl deacetylase